eukprot:3409898-Alexandrium_andersonii.AAC.1
MPFGVPDLEEPVAGLRSPAPLVVEERGHHAEGPDAAAQHHLSHLDRHLQGSVQLIEGNVRHADLWRELSEGNAVSPQPGVTAAHFAESSVVAEQIVAVALDELEEHLAPRDGLAALDERRLEHAEEPGQEASANWLITWRGETLSPDPREGWLRATGPPEKGLRCARWPVSSADSAPAQEAVRNAPLGSFADTC